MGGSPKKTGGMRGPLGSSGVSAKLDSSPEVQAECFKTLSVFFFSYVKCLISYGTFQKRTAGNF